jgi:hypothetical protein
MSWDRSTDAWVTLEVTRAFVGTNPTDESIVSGLRVIRSKSASQFGSECKCLLSPVMTLRDNGVI